MKGVYSIAEVVDDSHSPDCVTVFMCLREDDGKRFEDDQWSSLNAVKTMLFNNGAEVLDSLEEVAEMLNKIERG